jgi:radical SAM protein with 4Fe4S-binding SPASM domain
MPTNVEFTAPSDLCVIEREGKWLVLNPGVPAWICTNATGVALLKLCDGTRSTEEVLRNFATLSPQTSSLDALAFLKRAAGAGIFAPPPVWTFRPFGLNNLYLNLTQACNLRCLYCYAEDRESCPGTLRTENYYALLDNVAHHFDPSEMKVTFSGGEPLLFAGVFEVARKAKALGFSTYLLTNGTRITDANAALIGELFDHVRISVDGASRETNDQTRGVGSYDQIMAGLACLERVGKMAELAMTCTRLNAAEVSAASERYGGRLSFAPYFSTDEAREVNEKLYLSGTEYFEALTSAAKVNPFSGLSSAVSGRFINQRCSIAGGSVSVGPDGDVYPCHLLHYSELKCGNILETPFQEIYANSEILLKLRNQTVRDMEGCDACPIRYLCGGGCVARNYRETKNVCKPGSFCEYEQLAIPHALLANFDLELN